MFRIHCAIYLILVFAPSASTLRAGELPQVRFDVPQRLAARELLSDDLSSGRLIEITVPISVRIVKGDIQRVNEVAIEIDAGVDVVDFAPRTTLGSELAGDIKVNTTKESARSFDASLGGQSPIPIGDVVAQVAPSISAGKKEREVETTSVSRLAPKKPTAVSGTLGGGQGAFFQFRPSSQTTLEGQHALSLVFRVPDGWQASQLQVRCWARGERRVLWFDQLQVWGSAQATVEVALPGERPDPHVVAKEPMGEWVPRP
ncbi:MAG: hypothetical protein ACR2NU_09655 [Aeoliella sp.]